MEKNKVLIILLISFLGIESILKLNVYLIIILMTCVFTFLWYEDSNMTEKKTLKKNQKLMNERNISSKEAYLKQKQLNIIVESIPFPIVLLDIYGKIVLCNEACSLVRNLTMQEMTYIQNDFDEQIQEFMKDCYILEENMEKMMTIKNVEYRAVSIPVTTKGKFSGCMVMLQDISKVLEGEKMQKVFIADASHELKTPVSVIKGMVEILNREDFNDEVTRKDFMKQIEAETKRLENIVSDLLQLSKLSVNPILNRCKVDIHPLIDETVLSFTNVMKEKNIQLVKDYKFNDTVFCDFDKMLQVITNLISNAIKYSDCGTIRITTESDDKYFILKIQDEGVGMSKEDCDKIFERFYRADKDRSRKSGGSGLGLSIVKSIIDAHQGIIEVESELNVGSIFTIKLKN